MSIHRFGVEVKVNTDRVPADFLDAAASECRAQGFPVNDENLAWFAAELACSEGEVMGISMEMQA